MTYDVRLILESRAKRSNLRKPDEMVDSVMEVISMSIATVAMPKATEFGKFKTKAESLRRLPKNL